RTTMGKRRNPRPSARVSPIPISLSPKIDAAELATATYRPGQAISVAPLFQISRLNFPWKTALFLPKAAVPSRIDGREITLRTFLGLRNCISTYRSGLMIAGVEPAALLNHKKMDEVQTGGLGNVEWEPFRDWSGNMLRFHEANRSTEMLSTN